MKAILIARVSTDEQRKADNSLPAQVARLERYCQSKGFTVIKTFSFDESAYTNQRSEFDSILDYVIAQKEKVAVCCDKVDRLSRNIFDKRVSVLYEKALRDELEVHFASDGQVISSKISAVEKFNFGMSLGLAKYFSDAISDNVKRANEQKLRKGEWPGRAPYGYQNITTADDKNKIIVNEYAAGIIKKAYDLYATGAYSMSVLRAKIETDHGIAWSQGYIDSVLKNPFYYGLMLRSGKEYPHCYPPIISKAIFDKVQEIKAGFNKKRMKFAGLPYMYRGLLLCAECGLAITPSKHKGHVYYHCTQYNGKHGAAWLREEDITEQLAQIFKRLQVPNNIMQKMLTNLNALHIQKMEFQNQQTEEISKEQKLLTTMMDNLYLDRLKGRITEDDYDRYYQSFLEKREGINARLARLQEAEKNYYVTTKYLLEIANRAHDLFVGSKAEQRRQLIKLVLLNLRVDGKKIVYDVQKPFDSILQANDCQAWCAR